MTTEMFDFVWNVTENGYRWIEAKVSRENGEFEEEPCWLLTDEVALGSIYYWKRYAPLQAHTGLFRTFSELDPLDKDALRVFVATYGLLGIGKFFKLPAATNVSRTAPTVSGSPLSVGETHQDLVRAVGELKRAVAMWDMVIARNAAFLSHHIRWQDAEFAADGTPKKYAAWIYDSHPELAPGVPATTPGRSQEMIGAIPDQMRADDIVSPATFLVQKWVNNQLANGASPRLLFDVRLRKEVLRIVPKTLLGALWVQFAHAIEGNKEYRSCRECGKWFELSHKQSDGRTARREFCSDPCKSKDYRNRKDRAVRLSAKGQSVKEIAKELNTDPVTVKKWTAGRKRSR